MSELPPSKDLYKEIAAKFFGVSLNDVTPLQRKYIKSLAYYICYSNHLGAK